MEILKVENLTKSYGKGEAKVDAIKNINLSINKGEFVAIVGPSGSGKSTLLHLLGGVDKPTSGKVYINDVDIYTLKEKDLSIFLLSSSAGNSIFSFTLSTGIKL